MPPQPMREQINATNVTVTDVSWFSIASSVTVNSHIKEVNAWLRQYATQSKVPLLDLEKAVDTGDGYRDPDYTSDDGSHISKEGYAAITKYVTGALN